MFERYTESARRAIFYARAITIINNAPKIDSTHLLWGLMWPNLSRAQELFRLREKFPQYSKRPQRSLLVKTLKGPDLPLTDESKRTLAWSAIEADAMRDPWLDTDHLLLGMLRESECQTAQQLNAVGITLENARVIVAENRSSRPDYGPVLPLGAAPSMLAWFASGWRLWKAP
jgi:ATP-dependent Clp protease ATP-binding subunit ClpC